MREALRPIKARYAQVLDMSHRKMWMQCRHGCRMVLKNAFTVATCQPFLTEYDPL